MSLRSIMISGGGTGGHIYPALAIADEIKRRYPECYIHFVGAQGRMEMEKIPKAGYPIDGLWITGIERKIISKKNLLFPFRLLSALRQSTKLLKKHQPQAAIGVGGFASGALLYQASKKRIPTLIQEQNSYPGITNKILAKRADKICAGFSGMERWFPKEKIVLTGNPIRSSISSLDGLDQEALDFWGFSKDQRTLFVMGGSLGAKTMNSGVLKSLDQWKAKGYQVIWQTGKRYLPDMKALVNETDYPNLRMVDFIDRMDLAYAASDLIVSRAGAMSIAELALVGKPAILVPSPNVSEDHQTKNAMALTEVHAAKLLKDQKVSAELCQQVIDLFEGTELVAMSTAMAAQGKPHAAKDVVDELEKLITT